MPTVRIPIPLRKHTAGEANVTVGGSTVGEVFADLIARHPELAGFIYDEDGEFVTTTYESINVLLGNEDVRELEGPETAVGESDRLLILRTWPATISGGKQFNKPVGAAAPQ